MHDAERYFDGKQTTIDKAMLFPSSIDVWTMWIVTIFTTLSFRSIDFSISIQHGWIFQVLLSPTLWYWKLMNVSIIRGNPSPLRSRYADDWFKSNFETDQPLRLFDFHFFRFFFQSIVHSSSPKITMCISRYTNLVNVILIWVSRQKKLAIPSKYR